MVNFFISLYNAIQGFIHGGGIESTFSLAHPLGLLVVFCIVIIADIGFPVPFVDDLALLVTSFGIFSKPNPDYTPIILIVAALFVGRQIGSGVLYIIARVAGGPFLSWLKRRIPAIGKRLDSFKSRLDRYAVLAVTTGRLTPGLLQVTSIVSGAVRLNYYQFALAIALSSLVYDGVLVLLGFIAAHSPASRDPNLTFWLLISMIIIVTILWPVIFILSRRDKRPPPGKNDA